jgi:hypothetical protein
MGEERTAVIGSTVLAMAVEHVNTRGEKGL